MQSIKILLCLSVFLFADGETGCNVVFNNEPLGCTDQNPLDKKMMDVFTSEVQEVTIKEEMNITESLHQVKVLHQEKEVFIKRKISSDSLSCPPFCIEPMKIASVETVGEIETLAFIVKLKEKKSRLLIDVRENKAYKKGTIPGAINLPASMLEDKSLYQSEVLTLLGAVKDKGKWKFKNAHSLLIFGQSASTKEARVVIEKLLSFGYAETKLLFYRAGMTSWNSLGLTTL